jgi:hypothetical protein
MPSSRPECRISCRLTLPKPSASPAERPKQRSRRRGGTRATMAPPARITRLYALSVPVERHKRCTGLAAAVSAAIVGRKNMHSSSGWAVTTSAAPGGSAGPATQRIITCAVLGVGCRRLGAASTTHCASRGARSFLLRLLGLQASPCGCASTDEIKVKTQYNRRASNIVCRAASTGWLPCKHWFE